MKLFKKENRVAVSSQIAKVTIMMCEKYKMEKRIKFVRGRDEQMCSNQKALNVYEEFSKEC